MTNNVSPIDALQLNTEKIHTDMCTVVGSSSRLSGQQYIKQTGV